MPLPFEFGRNRVLINLLFFFSESHKIRPTPLCEAFIVFALEEVLLRAGKSRVVSLRVCGCVALLKLKGDFSPQNFPPRTLKRYHTCLFARVGVPSAFRRLLLFFFARKVKDLLQIFVLLRKVVVVLFFRPKLLLRLEKRKTIWATMMPTEMILMMIPWRQRRRTKF